MENWRSLHSWWDDQQRDGEKSVSHMFVFSINTHARGYSCLLLVYIDVQMLHKLDSNTLWGTLKWCKPQSKTIHLQFNSLIARNTGAHTHTGHTSFQKTTLHSMLATFYRSKIKLIQWEMSAQRLNGKWNINFDAQTMNWAINKPLNKFL